MNDNTFLWGVASSAFQMEGHISNDMTAWEADGKFDNGLKKPRYGIGAGHWERWEEDFKILKSLHVNAYRLSIEWARVEPLAEAWNQPAVDQYRRMIQRLLEYNITPVVTLHHFTHPQWFHEISPWHKPESIDSFTTYCKQLILQLPENIPYFITFNEPMVWLLAAYGDAKFPPGFKDFNLMASALENMLRAHKIMYNWFKINRPEAKVGIAKNLIVFDAARRFNPLDRMLKKAIDGFYNGMLPRAFQQNHIKFLLPGFIRFDRHIELDNGIDFWGVNYYYRMHVKMNWSVGDPIALTFYDRNGGGVTDLGWENYPVGLTQVVKTMAGYGKPIMITENGCAYNDDEKRLEHLKQHLMEVQKLRADNLPLTGYLHWSFLDNYEWLEGVDTRFGLVHVNYQNGYGRTIKASGKFYADFIKSEESSEKG